MRSATKLYLKLQKTTPFPKIPIQAPAIPASCPDDTVIEEPVEPTFELPAYESLPIDDGFEFGVSAGDIRYDAAVLWCYIDPSVDVALALWHVDENDTWTRVSESFDLRANERGYLHHEVSLSLPGNGIVMYFTFVMMQVSGSLGLQLVASALRLPQTALSHLRLAQWLVAFKVSRLGHSTMLPSTAS